MFLFSLFAHSVLLASNSKIDFTQPQPKLAEIYSAADAAGLPVFIRDIAEFAIGVAGVLAIILLLYSGIKRITSSGNSEAIGEADEIMWAALIGLMIALTSVLGLRTINPALTLLKPIDFSNVPIGEKTAQQVRLELGVGGDGEGTAGGGARLTAPGVPRQNIDALKRIYGNPGTESNMTKIKFQGKDLTVNKRAEAGFKAWSDCINQQVASGQPRYAITDIGGYENRSNVNNPGTPSLHSLGIAVDINPGQNPNRTTRTNIPQYVIQCAYQSGFRWGGNWNGVSDPMHFEYIGGGGFLNSAGNEQTRVTP